jgi:hypothetical protein
MLKNRLYVIVRTDLPCSLPAVQAGHAVAEFCLCSSDASKWRNQTLIYLKVDCLERLDRLCWKLSKKNINWYPFYEPDINNETTAIAVWIAEETSLFDSLEMLD